MIQSKLPRWPDEPPEMVPTIPGTEAVDWRARQDQMPPRRDLPPIGFAPPNTADFRLGLTLLHTPHMRPKRWQMVLAIGALAVAGWLAVAVVWSLVALVIG